tara:strand:+ start:116936 stop:117289 length:354 start_codon:yes stop_codon:yes gene_type:complete
MNETIYRLRQGEEVVGFLREFDNSSFYSANGYQWSGKSIQYDRIERYSGYKDRNDKRLFEGDVISSTDYPSNEYIIHYDALLTKFLLVSYSNRDIFNISLEEFVEQKSKVKRIGYLR